jgi:hypothetical protein
MSMQVSAAANGPCAALAAVEGASEHDEDEA